MDATIRLAEQRDVEGLLGIEEAFRSAGVGEWALLDRFTFERKIGAREVFVAERGGALLGYLAYTYLWGYPWIEYVRVLEPHRRRGVGRALLDALLEQLAAQGSSHLYSSRTADEEGARAWHHAMGFRECGRIRWIWPSPDEVVLIRGLDERER